MSYYGLWMIIIQSHETIESCFPLYIHCFLDRSDLSTSCWHARINLKYRNGLYGLSIMSVHYVVSLFVPLISFPLIWVFNVT